MASVFRSDLCLPFLFYECLKETSKEALSEEGIQWAYRETFGEEIGDKLADVIQRLINEAEKISGTSSDRPGPSKEVFGSSFNRYLTSLSGETICFFLADFDPVKAQELYCKVDMQIVTAAVGEKIRYVNEANLIRYEAVLFGMGGHYKGSGPKDNVIDMTKDPAAAKARLKSLGLA